MEQFVNTEVYQPLFENMYDIIRNATPYNDNLRRYIESINFGDVKLLSNYLVNLFKKGCHISVGMIVCKLYPHNKPTLRCSKYRK